MTDPRLSVVSVRSLVLISGPVAAGKTTTAVGLAALARIEGIPALAIDMDEMIEMAAGPDWSMISQAQRRLACRITSGLVDAAFANGAGLVSVAGSTLSGYEWDELTTSLGSSPSVTRVLLRVSLDESVRRAQGDPDRVSTKDPTYVAKIAAARDWASVPKPDIEVHTDGMTGQDVQERIASLVAPPLRSRGGGGGEVS